MHQVDIFSSLVFDSWIEPFPELRAPGVRDRHLIFEGDGVVLDLLIRAEDDRKCIHIGGQVLPGDEPISAVSNVKVLVQQGTRRTCTHTNALGEFTFHVDRDEMFNLTISLKNRRFMVRGLSHADPRLWRIVAVAAGGNGR